jgi:hypothetical protein
MKQVPVSAIHVPFGCLLLLFQISSSISNVSSGKSPTVTCAGFTNPPYLGRHSKYLFPFTLKKENIKYDQKQHPALNPTLWSQYP